MSDFPVINIDPDDGRRAHCRKRQKRASHTHATPSFLTMSG